jgi:hypothetical protein
MTYYEEANEKLMQARLLVSEVLNDYVFECDPCEWPDTEDAPRYEQHYLHGSAVAQLSAALGLLTVTLPHDYSEAVANER